jgi:hypothetical protein
MIRYSREETYRLADFYQQTLPPTTPDMDEIGKISMHETLDVIFEDNDDTENALMEFIGTYNCVVSNPEEYQLLYQFIFLLPFTEILCYCGDESWKGVLARWRTELEK